VLDPTLAERAAELLKARGETVSVAEGSAGGLISAALLAVPGASRYYVGGSVIYTRPAKEGLLGDVIETPKGLRGATEEWATWLAAATRTRIGTTWGIGEGGAAGPANPYGDPAGHAWVAVAGPDGVRTQHLLTGIDDRPSNMIAFAQAAIALLTECLESA
jgi:nicotinamide-nucleotide amidase